MTPQDKEVLLAELVRLSRPRFRRPDDITVQDYVTQAQCSPSTATMDLTRLVEQGILKTEEAFDPDTRRRIRVWFRA